MKFRVAFSIGVRIHLHVETLLGEQVPASRRARRDLSLPSRGRPARWVLPFAAPWPRHCPASPASACELLQKDAAARRLWEPRILATSKAGIRRARPSSRLFSFPSLPLMCVPHGLEGQAVGKRREVDGKCSIQPHPSLDEASHGTPPG